MNENIYNDEYKYNINLSKLSKDTLLIGIQPSVLDIVFEDPLDEESLSPPQVTPLPSEEKVDSLSLIFQKT